MTSPGSGKASVEIVGDVSNFGAGVERELNRELRDVDVDMRSVSRQVSEGLDAGVEDAKRSLGGLGEEAKESLGGIGDEADKAGRGIGEGIGRGTDRARDELGRFVASGKKSSNDFALSFKKLPNLLGGIGKLAGKALTAGIGVAAIASTVQTVTALVAALAPAVGAVGPLAAAFLASKLAAGVFKLAIMGVSDALSAGLTGDTAAFTEALKSMPPAAQAAIQEVVSLKDQLLGVRAVVQSSFFEPLVGQLRPLGEALLPRVTRELGLIATGFGNAGAETAFFLRQPAAIQSVSNALGDTRTAINNVSAGLPGLARAFLPLIEVGSSFLPGLTAGFGSLTQRLGAFLEKARDSGQLQAFFSAGLSVLGQLGQVLGNVGSIIKSVFTAATAGGGDFLGVIGQALEQFSTFLQSAEGQTALTSLFTVLGQAAGLFGQALGIVLPIVGQLVTALGGALAPVLPLIAGALTQLAPVLGQVGQAASGLLVPAIGAIVSILQALLPAVLPIVASLASSLLPVVTSLAPVIATLGTTIATVLTAALTALAPVFQQLLPVISELLVAVLPSLVPLIQQLGASFLAILPALTPLIQLLVNLLVLAIKPMAAALPVTIGFLVSLIGWFTKLSAPLVAAIGKIGAFLAKLLETGDVSAKVTAAFNAIRSVTVSVFNAVKNVIVSAFNTARSVTTSALNAMRSIVTGVWNTIKSATSAAFRAVVSYITSNWNNAKNVLKSISGTISSVIGFFGRLKSGIASQVSSAISTVRAIPGRIKGALGNLGSLLFSAGANVISGLISGIGSKLGALRAKAASAASTIRNLFPFSPAKEGPLSGSGSPEIAGGKIAQMIASGLERQTPEVRRSATRVAKAIGDITNLPGIKSPRFTQTPTLGAPIRNLPGMLRPALGTVIRGALKRKKTKAELARDAADRAAQRAREAKARALREQEAKDLLSGGGSSTGGGGSGSGGGSGVTFMAGAIVLNFYGTTPSSEQAYEMGKSAARGLYQTLLNRDVRTTVRTI